MKRKLQDSQNSYCFDNSYATETASSRRCLQSCQSGRLLNSTNTMDLYKKRQMNTTSRFLFDNFNEQKQEQKENPKPFFIRRNSKNSRNSSQSSKSSRGSCRSFNLNRKVSIKSNIKIASLTDRLKQKDLHIEITPDATPIQVKIRSPLTVKNVRNNEYACNEFKTL